jgi:hypothetical protein
VYGIARWRKPDQRQAAQHGEIAAGVQRKAPSDARGRDHYSPQRRPRDPRQVEAARIERDGIVEIIASDQLDDHRLSCRNLERR